MASTAAGVAVGSSLGHAMTGFFGGGGSSEPALEAQSANAPAQWNEQGFNNSNQAGSVSCEVQSKGENGVCGAKGIVCDAVFSCPPSNAIYTHMCPSLTHSTILPCADFLRCLDATNNNMDSCAFYLDQLKACQAQARNY
jgi:hypothetical protein